MAAAAAATLQTTMTQSLASCWRAKLQFARVSAPFEEWRRFSFVPSFFRPFLW